MRVRRSLFCLACFLAVSFAHAAPYLPPRFPESNAERRARIRGLMPEIERVYADIVAERHIPALTYGIMLDGELVHTAAIGMANVEQKIPAAADTRFRIASMTKSFTAMAILKLRDAGRLALQDPVEKFIPEFKAVKPLTADAPRTTLLHLLTMMPGFPEDNPWGDRQLAITQEALLEFVRDGVAMSNSPGVSFEYSNFAYALLGQVIVAVTREPYQRYITREILQPLGMSATTWEFGDVAAAKLALGYRWENDAWRLEPMLHDGAYGAMGGLLTTLPDFARYVAFHLAAWPPRDDADTGPVRRATLREMQKPTEITGLISDSKNLAGAPAPSVIGYGYGLRWVLDSANVINVGHSGGLPGFGSNYRLYPEHGFAVIAFANLTYAPMSVVNAKVGALLVEKAKLPRRALPPSAILETRQKEVAKLIQTWDPALAETIVGENFFLDRSLEEWRKHTQRVFQQAGKITSVGTLSPENQLRGTFPLITENGDVMVFFTLTPEKAARLQQLRLTFRPRGSAASRE